jgi:hypothetical protein
MCWADVGDAKASAQLTQLHTMHKAKRVAPV